MKNTARFLFAMLVALLAVNTSLHAQLINTMAGDGSFGNAIDGSPATAAGIGYPQAMFVDKFRNVYSVDANWNHVYKTDDYGNIYTVVNVAGAYGYTGDGGPATAAQTGVPSDIFVDTGGNLFFTDPNFSVVRKVDPSGIITTIAGNGSFGLSGDGGPATAASFTQPVGICGDRAGNIYIADASDQVIRKIDPAGIITTIAGTPSSSGFSGDLGPAVAAQLSSPQGISIDTFGS